MVSEVFSEGHETLVDQLLCDSLVRALEVEDDARVAQLLKQGDGLLLVQFSVFERDDGGGVHARSIHQFAPAVNPLSGIKKLWNVY